MIVKKLHILDEEEVRFRLLYQFMFYNLHKLTVINFFQKEVMQHGTY